MSITNNWSWWKGFWWNGTAKTLLHSWHIIKLVFPVEIKYVQHNLVQFCVQTLQHCNYHFSNGLTLKHIQTALIYILRLMWGFLVCMWTLVGRNEQTWTPHLYITNRSEIKQFQAVTLICACLSICMYWFRHVCVCVNLCVYVHSCMQEL